MNHFKNIVIFLLIFSSCSSGDNGDGGSPQNNIQPQYSGESTPPPVQREPRVPQRPQRPRQQLNPWTAFKRFFTRNTESSSEAQESQGSGQPQQTRSSPSPRTNPARQERTPFVLGRGEFECRKESNVLNCTLSK